MSNRFGVVLSAGKGTRMKAIDDSYNKTCYPILGKPVISYVLDAIKPLSLDKIVVVAGFGLKKTQEIVKNEADIVVQKEPLGTGHAVLQAEHLLNDLDGNTIILYGDTPLLRKETITNMMKKHEKEHAAITLLTAVITDPAGYNKIVRDDKTQKVLKINDVKEVHKEDYSLSEIDGGVYIVDNKILFKYLKQLQPDADHGELSLISIVEMAVNDNLKIETFITPERQEIFSLNNRFHLSYASKVIRKRVNFDLMLSGVSIEDPETTYISPDVIIGQDTIIHPNTSIFGKCKIGQSNEIGPNTYLQNVEVGDSNNITFSHIVDSIIKDNNSIGPFARLRQHCIIDGDSRIGNFVELKNAHFEKGVKCAHLTYIGDSEVGERTNIGCGSITANYDGFNKMNTKIGQDCFIGSGTIMVAPVELHDHSFTAAGSTITKDVLNDEMAIERTNQVNISHGSSKFLAKAKAKKERGQ